MRKHLLFGLPTMALCLFLQSVLFVATIRFYSRHEYLVNEAILLTNGPVSNARYSLRNMSFNRSPRRL